MVPKSSDTRDAGYGGFNPSGDIKFKVTSNRGAPLRSFDESCALTEKLQPGASYYLDHLNCELILEEEGSNTSNAKVYRRSDGVSYIKIEGSSLSLCNEQTGDEFHGTYSGGKAQLTEGSTTLDFEIEYIGEDIQVAQYVSGSHVGTQMYYATEASRYPCN